MNRLLLSALGGLALLHGACAVRSNPPDAQPHSSLAASPPAAATTSLDFDDQVLQQAARAALGQREGAILVIDPQTGRLRAVVNPRIAFGQAFPPGSTIKPFTALAAMRARLLERATQRQCSGRYARGNYVTLCSHPPSTTPFNLPQALAYSCNDYFGHVGERLSASAVNATLAGFGFGARTGAPAGSEVAGQLRSGAWRAQEALGDSESLLVTPVQLLLAYTALVNGGRLYRPQQGAGAAQLKAKLNLAAAQRTVLLEGMRGAVKFGTADKARLDQLPVYVFGKTGTSTASNGFQTQGWFAGFVAAPRATGVPAPDEIKLGLLVFLKRAHGSQGAEIARSLLDCGLRIADCGLTATGRPGDRETGRPGDRETGKIDFASVRLPATVRVKLGNPHSALRIPHSAPQQLPFEAYVAGVVAAEGSVENRLESLKALAVVSRTYAWQNVGRHAGEGFDFCSTTHCQRFWRSKQPLREAVRRAAAQTAGEVLRDRHGQVAEVYFHAACGGQTANLETLWGARAPEHLRGVRDEFCAGRPNRNWTCEIAAADLARALRGAPQTDVGAHLDGITVLQRDASGRAQTLALTGARRRELSGWEFKMLVGRKLGWQLLKSSWFDVQRRGDRFVFTGHGFGHGLGLCQEGAHVLAERGMSYRRILEFYFPGTESRLADHGTQTRWLPVSYTTENPAATAPGTAPERRATLASEHFRVSYPAQVAAREVEQMLHWLEAARADLARRIEQAQLRWPESAPVEIAVHATTADFIAATGRAGWVAAVTHGRRIETQPLALLQRRGILAATLRHELTHVAVEALSQGHAPRWLAEGLAILCAGEGRALERIKLKEQLTLDELERRLNQPAPAAATRELYAHAYREVRTLLRAEGEASVWKRVAQSR